MPRIDRVERRGRTIRAIFASGGALQCDRDFPPGRRLAAGQTIEQPILERLQEQATLHEAERVARRWLTRRRRSRADLLHRLRARGTPPTLAAQALDHLAAQGHLNDRAFAVSWTESRVRSHPQARRVIIRKLRAQGVDAALAEEVTRALDDDALASAIAVEQARRCADWEAYRARGAAALTRRGFTPAVRDRALRAAWPNPAPDGASEASSSP